MKTYIDFGISNNPMGKKIGRLVNLVNNFIKFGDNCGKIEGNDQKLSLPKRNKSQMIRFVVSKSMFPSEIRNEFMCQLVLVVFNKFCNCRII